MATVTFNDVSIHATKSVKCAGGCKRALKRKRKFYQTLSPFNKNAAGQLKSREEIYVELMAERGVWQAEPETRSHCKGERHG